MSGREFFASEGEDAGDDISSIPQVPEEQIFGSDRNPEGSAPMQSGMGRHHFTKDCQIWTTAKS